MAALVLPAFLIGLVWSLQAFDASRARSEAQALQTARSLMLDIDSEFKSLGAVAGALTTSQALQDGHLVAFQRQAEAARRYTNATNFVLTDVHGQQLLNTLKPYGTPLPRHGNPALIDKAAKSGRMQVSDLYVGAVTGAGVMSICLPVRVDGKLAYFLDAGQNAAEFASLLASRKLPADWVVAIIDGGGTIVARSRAPAQYLGKRAQPDLLRLIAAAPQGHARLMTLEGIAVYTSFARSPDSGWAVAIGIPAASVDGELWRSLAFNLSASALLLAVGVALAVFAGAHIRRAMAQLVEISAALGSGADLPPHH
ncbi:PAS domain S-box protein, partial [Rugamonas sp. FT81W]|nr:PAS domain S-box protein [Duganella vulcania]